MEFFAQQKVEIPLTSHRSSSNPCKPGLIPQRPCYISNRFDSGPTTRSDIDLPMTDSGTFHLILDNRAGETAVLVTIRGEIFWQE